MEKSTTGRRPVPTPGAGSLSGHTIATLIRRSLNPKAAGKLWIRPAGSRSRRISRAQWYASDPLFLMEAQTPGDQVIGNLVTAYERKISVRVTLKQYSVTQFVAPGNLGGPVYGGRFQLALYPFVNGDDPDTSDQFSCSHVPPNGYNKSRICNPQIDALLAQGRRTNLVSARKAIYARLQRLLYAQLPVALLYEEHQISAFTLRLHGQSTSLSGAFWNVGRWTLSP